MPRSGKRTHKTEAAQSLDKNSPFTRLPLNHGGVPGLD